MRLAEVGLGIFVGNRDSCRLAHEFDFTIHIGRDDTNPPQVCPIEYVTDQHAHFRYGDGYALTTGRIRPDITGQAVLTRLTEVFRRPGRILVHCHAGQTRSPVVAAFGCMVRGDRPAAACCRAYDACWAYGVVANICHAPLSDVYEVWKGLRG